MDPWLRDYEPVQPRGTDWRGLFRKLTAPIIFLFGLALKLGSLAKFAAIFVAFGGYTLIWGWKFALGVIVLIFLHEMGHFLEAQREGLHPKLPVFIPFFGAYVRYTRGHPWQTVRVAIAGPIMGGAAAFVFYLAAKSQHSDLLYALAYFGFFLNLINLLPVSILDGGAIWRSAKWLRHGGGRNLAIASYALYFGTALMLVLGMIASHVPQHRL